MDTRTVHRKLLGALMVLGVVTTACGASNKHSSPNPFHREPDLRPERDWPEDTYSAESFVYDEQTSDDEHDGDNEASDDASASEGENSDDWSDSSGSDSFDDSDDGFGDQDIGDRGDDDE